MPRKTMNLLPTSALGAPLTWRTGRCRHSLIECPSCQAISKRFAGKTEFMRPVYQAHRFSIVRNQAVCSLVPALLFWSCPSAVVFRVTKRVVDAINAARWRRFCSHILQKRFKRQPSIANGYPTPTVVAVRLASRISATVKHVRPRFVFRRLDKSVTAMSATSASVTSSSSECATGYLTYASTLTTTCPHGPSRSQRVEPDDCPFVLVPQYQSPVFYLWNSGPEFPSDFLMKTG